jgi:hypothetical protein
VNVKMVVLFPNVECWLTAVVQPEMQPENFVLLRVGRAGRVEVAVRHREPVLVGLGLVWAWCGSYLRPERVEQ